MNITISVRYWGIKNNKKPLYFLLILLNTLIMCYEMLQRYNQIKYINILNIQETFISSRALRCRQAIMTLLMQLIFMRNEYWAHFSIYYNDSTQGYVYYVMYCYIFDDTSSSCPLRNKSPLSYHGPSIQYASMVCILTKIEIGYKTFLYLHNKSPFTKQ